MRRVKRQQRQQRQLPTRGHADDNSVNGRLDRAEHRDL